MPDLKSGPQTKKDFEEYVRSHCGNPDAGTASSYCRAMEVMTKVFNEQNPAFSKVHNVWELTDPDEIMRLYERVKIEQDKFKAGHRGVFGSYAGRGDGYYRKGWCSAALKFFAQFRAAQLGRNLPSVIIGLPLLMMLVA